MAGALDSVSELSQPRFVPVQSFGNLLFVSGQVARKDGVLVATGRLGDEVSVDLGRECAHQCAQCISDVIDSTYGSLDVIEQILKLTVFVASSPTFTAHPDVADAASVHLIEALGERGRHARSAVGVASLPLGVPVEIEAILALRLESER